jgi:hypothetical protein
MINVNDLTHRIVVSICHSEFFQCPADENGQPRTQTNIEEQRGMTRVGLFPFSRFSFFWNRDVSILPPSLLARIVHNALAL